MYLLSNINSSTLFDYSYTYHYSKYSCSTAFYFIHVVFCYIVFLSGLFAFISRLHLKLKPSHQWFGRIYILSMLYATASSLLIHNTGLPLAVLISFCFCIGGLTIAWCLILCHKQWLQKITLQKTQTFLNENDFINKNHKPKLKNIMNELKTNILKERSLIQRIFSLKTFHGMFMFMSWINITGRIFASNQSGDFECYTYPIYKFGNITNQYNLNQTDLLFDIVPEENPNYERLPWANNELVWSIGLSIGPLAFAFLFGLLWSVIVFHQIKNKYFKENKGKS